MYLLSAIHTGSVFSSFAFLKRTVRLTVLFCWHLLGRARLTTFDKAELNEMFFPCTDTSWLALRRMPIYQHTSKVQATKQQRVSVIHDLSNQASSDSRNFVQEVGFENELIGLKYFGLKFEAFSGQLKVSDLVSGPLNSSVPGQSDSI